MGLIVLVEVLILSFIYYSKNGLDTSYMGMPNRYYMISKTILKILMSLYFAVDYRLSLSIVYIFTITGLWGLYIFWHRLFSLHNFNQKYFYI